MIYEKTYENIRKHTIMYIDESAIFHPKKNIYDSINLKKYCLIIMEIIQILLSVAQEL